MTYWRLSKYTNRRLRALVRRYHLGIPKAKYHITIGPNGIPDGGKTYNPPITATTRTFKLLPDRKGHMILVLIVDSLVLPKHRTRLVAAGYTSLTRSPLLYITLGYTKETFFPTIERLKLVITGWYQNNKIY